MTAPRTIRFSEREKPGRKPKPDGRLERKRRALIDRKSHLRTKIAKAEMKAVQVLRRLDELKAKLIRLEAQ